MLPCLDTMDFNSPLISMFLANQIPQVLAWANQIRFRFSVILAIQFLIWSKRRILQNPLSWLCMYTSLESYEVHSWLCTPKPYILELIHAFVPEVSANEDKLVKLRSKSSQDFENIIA